MAIRTHIALAMIAFASMFLLGAFATAAFAEDGGQALRGAEVASQPASDLDCTPLAGSNVNAQNYTTYASPVHSYLTKSGNGYMRVQGKVTGQGIVVAYYDNDYALQSRQVIPAELPLFGGFYETDDNYYIVTGQANAEENDATEVFRVTKYDKNWNRIGSCGLHGANTTYPFDAGSCRIAETSGYLVIRTCHEMYTSSDGLNHQANVTILVNIQTMSVVDSYTSVMNSSYGYVSHSFNQFVGLEDNKIVSVDHGDSHPRAICLMKYPTDVTTGRFVSSNVQTINVMTFAGNAGKNTTGASVGAFEISPSSYLIAGNSVVQDDQFASRKTRNVFVAAVDRGTNAVTINWITEYEENGSAAATTPQMVQTGSNQYLVLWSMGENVHYVFVDGNGQTTSEIYSMQGSLSDCVPIVDGGKVVWYTWKNGDETFYSIPIDAPSSVDVVSATYDHDYQWTKTENGLATMTCTKCGGEKTGKVPTAFSVYWRDASSSDSYYYSNTPSGLGVDSTVLWMYSNVQYSAESDNTFAEYEAETSDPEHCFVNVEARKITFSDAGTYTVTIYPKYNPSLRKQATIRVTKPIESVALFADRQSPQQYGLPIRLIAEPNGGRGTLTYVFKISGPDGDRTLTPGNSGRLNYLEWQPSTVGEYTIRAEVTDAGDNNNVVASNDMPFTIERADVAVTGGKQIGAEGSLVYGQGLSDLSVKNASFIAATSMAPITGEFSLASPDAVLDAGEHEVIWTFIPDSTNYNSLSGSFVATVDKALLTVRYEGEQIEWNGEPELKVIVEDFVGDENEVNAIGYVAPKINRPDTLIPGESYALIPAGGEAKNYDFDYSNAEGILVVGEKPQWVLVGEQIDALGALPADATIEQQDAYIADVRAAKSAYEKLSEVERANLSERRAILVSAEESAFGVLIDRAQTQANIDMAAASDEEMLQDLNELGQSAQAAISAAESSNDAAQAEEQMIAEQIEASKRAIADSADAKAKATVYKQAADAVKQKADVASESAQAFSDLVVSLQNENPECDFSIRMAESNEAVANAESRVSAAAGDVEAASKISASADAAASVANACKEAAATRAVEAIGAAKAAADVDARDASSKQSIADSARAAAEMAKAKADESYAAAQSDALEGKTAEEKLFAAQQAVVDAADAKSAADDAKAAADAYETAAQKAHESAVSYKQLVNDVKSVDDELVSESVANEALAMEQEMTAVVSDATQLVATATDAVADAESATRNADGVMAEVGAAVVEDMIGQVNSAIDAAKAAQDDADIAKLAADEAQQKASQSIADAKATAGKTADQQLADANQATEDAAAAKAAAQAYQDKANAAQAAAENASRLSTLLSSLESYATADQKEAISAATASASAQSAAASDAVNAARASMNAANASVSQASEQVSAAKEAVQKEEQAKKAEEAKKLDGKITIKVKKKVLSIKLGKSLKASKAYKVTSNLSGGKVTYKKVKGNKKITVAKNGKIKLAKKGLKKGKTYTIKVKAISAATANYNAATSKVISVKIKVK